MNDDIKQILPEEWQRTISGVARKVALINDFMAIGWTGHKLAAKVLLGELKHRFEFAQIQREELFTFLSNYRDTSQLKCILIGWLFDKKGVVSFRWSFGSRSLITNEHPYAEGTGARSFLKNFQTGELHHDSPDPYFNAISDTLLQAGRIIGEELLTGRTLQELYGGGIEIIYFSGKKFQQLDSVTFLFWTLDVHVDKSIGYTLGPIIKYQYMEDVLVIKTLRGSAGKINRTEFHVVFPVYRNSLHVNMPTGFQADRTKFFCNFFYIPVRNKGEIVFCLVLPIDNGMIRFQLHAEGGTVQETLDVNDSFPHYLMEVLGPKISKL